MKNKYRHGSSVQAKSRRLLAGFAVMCIAAVFSFALLGCDSDPGGGDKSVSITIKNTTTGDTAKAITGVEVIDVYSMTYLVGSEDEYDTDKTVAAGETMSFTITPTDDKGYYSCNVTVCYGTGVSDYAFANVGGTDRTAVTLNFGYSSTLQIYQLKKEE